MQVGRWWLFRLALLLRPLVYLLTVVRYRSVGTVPSAVVCYVHIRFGLVSTSVDQNSVAEGVRDRKKFAAEKLEAGAHQRI